MLQGGEIEVESEVGKGSTFRVSLSFAPGNEVKREMLHEQQGNIHGDQKDLKGMRILVVEDNKMNQFVARQLLNRWKAEVTVADNGEDALLLMEQDDYALVFMDLQMPVMGGFETTEIIRSGQRAARNQHVPIIALTADAFYETRQKVVNHGMNDFVTKPFDQEELYSKIVRYLPV
jgi:CheY-like chemotaxis protein